MICRKSETDMSNGADESSFLRPYGAIALWAFLLNGAWELLQCVFLYDMWDWPFWKSMLWMWGATLGDVAIVLALVAVSAQLTGFSRSAFWIALVGIGLIAAVLLEWVARRADLWSYSSAMPTIGLFGEEIGLAPLVQITFLPVLSVYLSDRFRGRIRWLEISG